MFIRGSKLSASGFSLIEVALAIVVVSVGILAMFGLMTSGLDASSRAVSETQASEFAENVMNSMRVESLAESKDNVAVTNVLDKWQTYWLNFSKGTIQIPVPGWPAYSTAPIYLGITAPGAYNTLALTNLSFRGGVDTNAAISLGIRYSLNINLLTAPEGYNRHIPKLPANYFTIVGVTLKVWDGLYGVPNDSDAITFYSEFNNPGTL